MRNVAICKRTYLWVCVLESTSLWLWVSKPNLTLAHGPNKFFLQLPIEARNSFNFSVDFYRWRDFISTSITERECVCIRIEGWCLGGVCIPAEPRRRGRRVNRNHRRRRRRRGFLRSSRRPTIDHQTVGMNLSIVYLVCTIDQNTGWARALDR